MSVNLSKETDTMWHSIKHSIRTAVGLMAVSVSASLVEANNVQVAIEGSLLTVFGDNLGNSVLIAQSANEVVVSGQSGTLINGLPSVSFPGVLLNAVEVRLGGGNDSLSLTDVQIANDLYVSLGEGNDSIVTSGTNAVGANMTIEADAGSDTINLSGMIVFEDAYIDGGLGVLSADLSDMDLRKGLTILSDASADQIRVVNSWISESLSIESKGGNDLVSLTNSMSFSAMVNTDLGADQVSMANWMTLEDIGIFTGPGNDIVSLSFVASGKSMTVSVDAGNDSVIGASVSITEDAVFEGGAGTDSITDRGITGGIKKEIKEFERRLN
jgi:hypothetical protein